MRKYRPAMPMLLGLSLVALADCAPEAMTTFRQSSRGPRGFGFCGRQLSPNGNIEAAAQMIFANGAPLPTSRREPTFSTISRLEPKGLRCAGRMAAQRCDGGCVQPYGLTPGHRPTRGGGADLPSGRMDSQQERGPFRDGLEVRTRYFRCTDNIASGSARKSLDDDLSRSALNLGGDYQWRTKARRRARQTADIGLYPIGRQPVLERRDP
jgi:hypothetical protein